jgi:hypothetical protein
MGVRKWNLLKYARNDSVASVALSVPFLGGVRRVVRRLAIGTWEHLSSAAPFLLTLYPMDGVLLSPRLSLWEQRS